jgi:hypothetical protein
MLIFSRGSTEVDQPKSSTAAKRLDLRSSSWFNCGRRHRDNRAGSAAMLTKRILSTLMIVVVAIVAFLAWAAWNEGNLGWAHMIGLGASALLLVLIWFWPGTWQPRQPPP